MTGRDQSRSELRRTAIQQEAAGREQTPSLRLADQGDGIWQVWCEDCGARAGLARPDMPMRLRHSCQMLPPFILYPDVSPHLPSSDASGPTP